GGGGVPAPRSPAREPRPPSCLLLPPPWGAAMTVCREGLGCQPTGSPNCGYGGSWIFSCPKPPPICSTSRRDGCRSWTSLESLPPPRSPPPLLRSGRNIGLC
ncbi:TRIOBP isoform 7, partial [Pongo abelii]